MPLTRRQATPEDAPLLAAQSFRAYFGTGALADLEDRYRNPRVYPTETMSIFERDGVPVGQARTIPFRGWIGGVETKVGGLASVAVAPEARRTGVADAMVREHLQRLHDEGTPWAMLYPYSPRFYARYGWATASTRIRWRYPAGAFPVFAERSAVVRVSLADDAQRDAVQAVYERHCRAQNGSLWRSPAHLRDLWRGDREFAVGVRDGDGLSGYLLYRYINTVPRPTLLEVAEWVALDGRAERALLGFLAVQGEQADEVLLDTPPDHPLPHLVDKGVPDAENREMPVEHHPIGVAYLGAMARVVDLGAALAGRGYPPASRGRVAFAARDELIRDNEELRTLIIDDGRPRIEAGWSAGTPLLRGPIGALTQVLVGTVRLPDALRLGLVQADGQVGGVGELLGLPPPYPLVVF